MWHNDIFDSCAAVDCLYLPYCRKFLEQLIYVIKYACVTSTWKRSDVKQIQRTRSITKPPTHGEKRQPHNWWREVWRWRSNFSRQHDVPRAFFDKKLVKISSYHMRPLCTEYIIVLRKHRHLPSNCWYCKYLGQPCFRRRYWCKHWLAIISSDLIVLFCRQIKVYYLYFFDKTRVWFVKTIFSCWWKVKYQFAHGRRAIYQDIPTSEIQFT